MKSAPYFDGSNYPYWKSRMKYFLKIQGEQVWNSLKYGQGPLLRLDVNGKSTSELKPKQEWDKLDNKGSEANSWALRHSL